MVDKGIGLENLHFIAIILIAQVMLVVGQTANNLIRSWLMLHMTTRIGISLISDFLCKLMRLPIAFSTPKWSVILYNASVTITVFRYLFPVHC